MPGSVPPTRDLKLMGFLALMALTLVASEMTRWPGDRPWLDGRMLFGLWIPLAAGLLLTERSSALGLGLGNWRRGLRALGAGLPLAVVAVFLLVQFGGVRGFYQTASPWAILAPRYAQEILQVEVCFRGVLLFGLAPRLGLWPAAALTLLPYGLIHLDKPIAEALGSVPVGLGLAIVAIWTGSIWYGFAIHLAGAVALTLLAGS